MRESLPRYRNSTPALAFASAFALLFLAVIPASADIYLVQKEHKSQKYGEEDAKVSDMVIRTWVTEGKLRQDYGEPATFVHITRLDRRPGELISYLINLGTGPFGRTYWTFCHPRSSVPPRVTSDDQDNGSAGRKDTEPASPTDSRKALTITDTGETKLINNFWCKKYVVKETLTSTELSSEIWVTTDILSKLEQYRLGWGLRIDRSDSKLNFREAGSGVSGDMASIKGFPVLIIEIEHNKYVHYERRLELLEFKEAPLPPSQFELPEGLTKKYMGAMAHPPECED